MIHSTKFRQDVITGFDIGHSAYIETATGTNHMYFLLGTDTKVINKGMRCKDYLQEVFLSKRFKSCKNTQIYGYKLRGVRSATKLFLKWPNRDMTKYAINIERCIAYINKAYDINISVAVLKEYIELNMPLNWFTDIINPVQASAICSLLRSCMIWGRDSFKEVLEDIDDLEDEFDEVFPEKDWLGNRSRKQLNFLGNLRAQKILGKWDFCSKQYKKNPSSEYHNRSGWVTTSNESTKYADNTATLSLLDKAPSSGALSDQCVLIDDNGYLLYDKLIKNVDDFSKRFLKKCKGPIPRLTFVFNNAMLSDHENQSAYFMVSERHRDLMSVTTNVYHTKITVSGASLETYGKEIYEFIRICRLFNYMSDINPVFKQQWHTNFSHTIANNCLLSGSEDEFVEFFMSKTCNKHKALAEKTRLFNRLYNVLTK